MAVDPVPSLRDTDDVVVEAINYGTGNAGSFLPAEAGQEYRVWNDKGNVKTSSPMTSVLVTVRDENGQEILNITTQHWVEIKSTTIHAGVSGGSISGYTNDNMADFQPVGKDNFVVLGNIPFDCYRKILVRMKIPTSGLKAGVTFKIYVTNQQAQSSIAKWITGLHGNGVVYQTSGAFAVSINGVDASLLDIEKGFSLITDSQVYYGNSQQYSAGGLSNDTYKIYLTQTGAVSSTTGTIPSNSIELSRAVVVSEEWTSVTDKRLFLANVMVGLDAAKTATPTKNQVYVATDTEKLYICFADDSWSQVIPYPDMVTKTGDFTAGKLVKINNASGIVEMASNTDAEVADAVTKKHTQHTDTGTTQTTFQIDSGNSGPKVKNSAGEMQARNAADNAYADFRAKLLYGDGSYLIGVGVAAATVLTISAKAAEDIDLGEAVYISGASGQFPEVSLADNTDSAKHAFVGLAAESKTSGQTILILIRGELTGLVTDGFVDGDILYLSTAGAITKTIPTSGGVAVVGYCSYAHSSAGKIVVVYHSPHSLYVPAGVDITLRMGDSVGVNKIDFKNYANTIVASINSYGEFIRTEQVLTSGAAIAWDLKNGNRAILVAAHNFTITITKPSRAIDATLIISQDGTGNRVLDEIITQKDEDIGTAEVHADTDIIDLSIDIPTGARIRFKTSAADLPDPLVVDTIYYAIRTSENHIKVATSKANAFLGTAIDITDQGTGTHTVQQLVKWPGGTLGVLQTAAGGEDIIKLHYKTSDEQWYGEIVSNFS